MASPPEGSPLEQRLGYRFRDPSLLETALTHRSRAHEAGLHSTEHYERLEFLGDALIGFLIAERLYRDDDEAPEGILSRRRQSVVRTSSLAKAASALGLGEKIRLGRGEARTGGRAKPSLLADVFEAVVGAIYIDGGIRSARAFVRRRLGDLARAASSADSLGDDHKTRLQETVQAKLRRTPAYRIVSTSGPDHALEFEVEVRLGRKVLGRGRGASRRQAEQDAAGTALQHLEETGELS